MAKAPFVVSFSPIFDESTRWADLLLPDQTYLESWDLVFPSRAAAAVSLRQPVVPSPTKAMQTGEVILRLAAALGGKVAEAIPWKSYRDAAGARLELMAAEPDGVLDELGEKGVCKLVRKDAGAASALVDVGPAFPGKAATVGDPAEYPFVLCPFRDRGHAEGGSRQFPWLAELPGAGDDPWSGYVEISAEDAARLSVEDGAWVAVTSPVGRAQLRARIHPHIRPGVLGLRLGGWGRHVGDLDGLPTRLLADATDPSGNWLAWATRAKVETIA
jgi:anaerobic selenocysteine-containing dehydrogenase